MKRSIARKWAQALESGEYKQARHALRKGDKFCCLGVLCNIHAQEHPEIAVQQKRKQHYLNEDAILPHPVQEWAGLATPNGKLKSYDALTVLNDYTELTFPEIAKVIRKHWKEL